MTDARELADRLIAAKCTSRDGTVVHASMADVLAALAPMPVERERIARCLVEHDPNYNTLHMPGDAPRKWHSSGGVFDTHPMSEGCAEKVRVRADAVIATLSHQPEGGGDGQTEANRCEQIALDATHQIEALPTVGLHETQKTARIQLIVFGAISRALPRSHPELIHGIE